MSKQKIPSDEEFARVKKLTRARWENIESISNVVTEYVSKLCPLHYFTLMPQGDNEFFACVFYKKDKDIAICEQSGVTDKIKDFIYKELEMHGKGKKNEIKVIFEFDSDESVERDFGGDYFLRLR